MLTGMGMLSKGFVEVLRRDAAQAFAEGRMVWVVQLAEKTFSHSSTQSMPTWADAIAAVEGEGWTLAEWAVSDRDGAPKAYPLFRRR